jgi:hypothetical protein
MAVKPGCTHCAAEDWRSADHENPHSLRIATAFLAGLNGKSDRPIGSNGPETGLECPTISRSPQPSVLGQPPVRINPRARNPQRSCSTLHDRSDRAYLPGTTVAETPEEKHKRPSRGRLFFCAPSCTRQRQRWLGDGAIVAQRQCTHRRSCNLDLLH